MRDTKARTLGFTAVVLACGSYAVGHASADPTTEPDAAALATQVQQQAATITEIRATTAKLQKGLLDETDKTARLLNCLAYGDFHYYKRPVSGRRVRLPVMIWDMSRQECRPSKDPWKPASRAITPVGR